MTRALTLSVALLLGLLIGGCHGGESAAMAPASASAAPRPATSAAAKKPAPGKTAWRMRAKKRIAITIDDGPALTYVLRAMAAAERHGGRITFFVTGRWASRDAQIVRLMQQHGHLVGNHTWDHVDLAKCADAKVRDQLKRTSDLIAKQGGTRPVFYRPPYGAHNARVDKIASDLGMKVILWDVDPQDWDVHHSADRTVNYVLSHARPDEVILLHEVHHTYTVLERIFDGLHKQGFTCVRLDELPRHPRSAPRGVKAGA